MTPLIARTTGLLGFYLGLSSLTAVVLNWGIVGLYAGIFGYYTWSFVVVAAGFRYGGWADRATEMMAERGSTNSDGETGN
jgi:Na+-driven multidrug efflux pump